MLWGLPGPPEMRGTDAEVPACATLSSLLPRRVLFLIPGRLFLQTAGPTDSRGPGTSTGRLSVISQRGGLSVISQGGGDEDGAAFPRLLSRSALALASYPSSLTSRFFHKLHLYVCLERAGWGPLSLDLYSPAPPQGCKG